MSNLITHQHHIGREAVPRESSEDIPRVEEHLAINLLVHEAAPRGWSNLLAGVGPSVGVMEIEEYVKPQLMGTAGEGQSVGRVCGQLFCAGAVVFRLPPARCGQAS